MFLHFGEKIGKYGGDLEVGKGVEGEDNCGDDDETDGDERHNLSKQRFAIFCDNLPLEPHPCSE